MIVGGPFAILALKRAVDGAALLERNEQVGVGDRNKYVRRVCCR
jgi:hypothetical protein